MDARSCRPQLKLASGSQFINVGRAFDKSTGRTYHQNSVLQPHIVDAPEGVETIWRGRELLDIGPDTVDTLEHVHEFPAGYHCDPVAKDDCATEAILVEHQGILDRQCPGTHPAAGGLTVDPDARVRNGIRYPDERDAIANGDRDAESGVDRES